MDNTLLRDLALCEQTVLDLTGPATMQTVIRATFESPEVCYAFTSEMMRGIRIDEEYSDIALLGLFATPLQKGTLLRLIWAARYNIH